VITIGIDVGSLTAEAVAVDQGRVVASTRISVRPDPVDSATAVLADLEETLRARGSTGQAVGQRVVTGYGRERIIEAGLAQRQVSEISCHGFGAFCAAPKVRTIIDIGGQDAKVIRVDDRGELQDFAMNDKCAAGAGHFLELMSRTLEVSLDELGPLALGARRAVEMSSRCSIFIETEVIHSLQRGVTRAELAAGVCAAMAERVVSLVRRVGVAPAVAMTGGVAKNSAVRREVEKRLALRLVDFTLDPQLIGAYGAAMLAQREGGAR
jgi:(R)-2-hydroxyacyl-CoA dehydratese activating ATPase